MERQTGLANGIKQEKVQEKEEGKGRFRQYLAAVVVNLLGLSFGAAVGWCSPVQDELMAGDSPLGEPLGEEMFSWMGSSTFLGGIAGTIVWGRLADRWGRKWAGYAAVVPMLIGWLSLLLCYSPALLIAGRVFVGFSGSAGFILCPLYVAEISDDGVRGKLGSMIMLFFNGGILLAYVAGSRLPYRPLCLLCACLPAVFVLFFWRLPETPAYLWSKNRFREARDSLASFRGGDRDLVEREFARISETSKSEEDARYADLLRTKGSRRAYLIGFVLMGLQQLDGILVVVTYTASIFAAAGSTLGADTSAIIVGLVQVAASYFSSMTIERSGRKFLLLMSFGIMTVSLSALGVYFLMLDAGNDVSSYALVPVVSLCSFTFAYALGSGPIPFVLMSETFEPKLRALATSTLVLWGTLLAFTTVKIFPFMLAILAQSGSFFVFAGFCVFGFFFVWFYIPETKGRSLLEILEELNGGKFSPEEMKDSLKKVDV